MKLLIVDDQLATLTGLTQGIDWAGIGFDEVDTAQNAMEARISFARDVPDLMLCDIEMPVESGLDLCAWVRSEGCQTKIILLTCHSDFAYAQEAIRLGVSDYIVQPAPYHRIRDKAEKVMAEIAKESSHHEMISLGQTYTSKQEEINSSLLRGFLMNTVERNILEELPEFPDLHKQGCLVLLQTVQQTEKIREWNDNTLSIAIRNTIQDTFERKTYIRTISLMETNTWALAVQRKDGSVMTRDDLVGKLHYLESMFDMYMPCSLAFYTRVLPDLEDIREQWKALVQMRNSNVTGKKGLYAEQAPNDASGTYREQYYRWNMILKNSGAADMEKDAVNVLRGLAASGRLNSTVLLAFHRDFTRLFLSLDNHDGISEYLDADTLYMDAMHSQAAMEELIHRVAELYRAENETEGGNSISRTIQEYVEEHLSDNIRKEDLAELMHLNEDYLTRIFKKETGMSIKSYIIKQKMEAARELLQTTSLSVSSVAIQLGYNNFSHFAASYKKEFGITPAEEKEKRNK